jgi:hypothetical protein
MEFRPASDSDFRFTKHQMILVGILTTLCVTARNDFLVYNCLLCEIELWKNGMQNMKHFYCDPSIIIDKNLLLQKRNEFFTKFCWWYDAKRGISKNHQNPGNYDECFQTMMMNHLSESAKWSLIAGNIYTTTINSSITNNNNIVSEENILKNTSASKEPSKVSSLRAINAKEVRKQNIAKRDNELKQNFEKKKNSTSTTTASSKLWPQHNESCSLIFPN